VKHALRSPEGEAGLAQLNHRSNDMHYVYIIQSESHPEERYVGYSADLKTRLNYHNNGKSPHTSKYLPWRLLFYSAFQNKQTALSFEAYLKSHSGKAFTAKRLLS
jgi:putative endonuclease